MTVRPELLARFGDDPDALEWARSIVQESIDALEEAAALPQAGPEFKRLAKWTATWMRDQLTGGPGERGCVGRFDARLARSSTTFGLRDLRVAPLGAGHPWVTARGADLAGVWHELIDGRSMIAAGDEVVRRDSPGEPWRVVGHVGENGALVEAQPDGGDPS